MDRRRTSHPPRESSPPSIDEARLASLVRQMYTAREADVTPPREMHAKLARRLDALHRTRRPQSRYPHLLGAGALAVALLLVLSSIGPSALAAGMHAASQSVITVVRSAVSSDGPRNSANHDGPTKSAAVAAVNPTATQAPNTAAAPTTGASTKPPVTAPTVARSANPTAPVVAAVRTGLPTSGACSAAVPANGAGNPATCTTTRAAESVTPTPAKRATSGAAGTATDWSTGTPSATKPATASGTPATQTGTRAGTPTPNAPAGTFAAAGGNVKSPTATGVAQANPATSVDSHAGTPSVASRRLGSTLPPIAQTATPSTVVGTVNAGAAAITPTPDIPEAAATAVGAMARGTPAGTTRAPSKTP